MAPGDQRPRGPRVAAGGPFEPLPAGQPPTADPVRAPARPGPLRYPRAAVGRRARIVAAIDLGSNSIHLLVAVVAGHRVEPLADESVFVPLGPAAEAGLMGEPTRLAVVAALAQHADHARRLQATRIAVAGTEPLRRSADAAVLIAAVRRQAGVEIDVVSHAEEGLLTLLGVTSGRRVRSELVVVDVGGGSSEFVDVGPGRPPSAGGVQAGAARLTTRLVEHDPPDETDMLALRTEARRLVAEAPPFHPAEIVAVGGTATNLLRVLPVATIDRTLTRRRLTIAMLTLQAESAEVAAERHAVRPVRARLLPAGAAILEAILLRYGLGRMQVSDAGIREGLALALARAGANWRDQLPQLSGGWSP